MLIFNSDGTNNTRFFDGASWVADDFSTPVGHQIIYPGTGFTYSAGDAAAKLVFSGDVKTTKTAIHIYGGASTINIVGPPYPSADTRLVTTSLASTLVPYADGFTVYTNDGTMSVTPGAGFYLTDGTDILDDTFTPLSPSATDKMFRNRGIILGSLSGDRIWVVNSPIP